MELRFLKGKQSASDRSSIIERGILSQGRVCRTELVMHLTESRTFPCSVECSFSDSDGALGIDPRDPEGVPCSRQRH